MRSFSFAVLSLLVLVSPAVAAVQTIVVCAPGYPGSTQEAQPVMDAFAKALAGLAKKPEGSLAAVYYASEPDGLARVAKADVVAAIVPLPFWLQHGASLRLEPRLQVATEQGNEESWSLVAQRGRIKGVHDLAGFTIYSIAGYAPSFVRAALGNFGALPNSADVLESAQVLSSMRKAAKGADVAVLLDGAQSASLSSLPFADKLEVVAHSPPLPVAYVVSVSGRLRKDVEAALVALAKSDVGAEALAAMRMRGFAPLAGESPTKLRQLLGAHK